MLWRSHSVPLSCSWGQGQAAHFKRSGFWSIGLSNNLKDSKHKPKSRRAQRYRISPWRSSSWKIYFYVQCSSPVTVPKTLSSVLKAITHLVTAGAGTQAHTHTRHRYADAHSLHPLVLQEHPICLCAHLT